MRYSLTTHDQDKLIAAIDDTERHIANTDPKAALAALRRARTIYNTSIDAWQSVAVGPIHERLSAAEMTLAELISGRAIVSLK